MGHAGITHDDAHKAFPQRTLTTTLKTEPVAESVSVALPGLSSYATPCKEGVRMPASAVSNRDSAIDGSQSSYRFEVEHTCPLPESFVSLW